MPKKTKWFGPTRQFDAMREATIFLEEQNEELGHELTGVNVELVRQESALNGVSWSAKITYDDPNPKPIDRLCDAARAMRFDLSKVVYSITLRDLIDVLYEDVRVDVDKLLATDELKGICTWAAGEGGISILDIEHTLKMALIYGFPKLSAMRRLEKSDG